MTYWRRRATLIYIFSERIDKGLVVMTTAQELRDKLDQARARLRTVIQENSESWEMGEDDNWGVRKIAEHTIDNENYFANAVASAMDARAVDPITVNAATPEHALDLFTQVEKDTNRVYGYIEDGDIKKPADILLGQGFEPTIGGAVDFAIWHILDHMKQIQALAQVD